MRVVLNIAAIAMLSSVSVVGVAVAADDFGDHFTNEVPRGFGDPEGGINYDAFAMDDATAEMLNNILPAAGDEDDMDAEVDSDVDVDVEVDVEVETDADVEVETEHDDEDEHEGHEHHDHDHEDDADSEE